MAGVPDAISAAGMMDHALVPVSAGWMRANWGAWVQSLPAKLRTTNSRGQQVPAYIPEAFDCENHAAACMVHGTYGNALTALRLGYQAGLAKGVVLYTAEPRRANGNRSGRHAICWRMGHNSKIYFFEPADGTNQTLTKREIKSITAICAI